MRCAVAFVAGLFLSNAYAQDTAVVRKMSENKFVAVPGLPACLTSSVQSGDPTKGSSLLAFKGKAGCRVPWHWHTPTEHVMIVSGSAVFEMRDHKGALAVGPGGYARMPSKHVHRFTCTSACSGFVSSDAAFDIHYVDAAGKEITPEAALATKK